MGGVKRRALRRGAPDSDYAAGNPSILPGSMRLGSAPNLAGAAGAVLFFVGPQRQTPQGYGSENREDRQTAPEESLFG